MPPNPLNILREGKGAKAVMSLADEVRAEMAAEKAGKLDKFQLEAQRKAKEASNPPVKASEAYGKHEGSYIKPIFYDRMMVDLSKGKLGGPGFSGIQLIDPEYAKARAVAGVTDKKMGTRILNRNKAQVPKGAKVIWTPSVGGLEQHKSNSTMFSEFADIFANQRKNMTPEQLQKLSDRASTETDNNGRLIFPNGIDLSSRNFRKAVKTYDQRALMANIFAGRGVGGEKGRTVPMEELLEKNLDPNMAKAGTLDLGNRLFRLDDNVIDRPDLHSDYPIILTGEDLDVNYLPTPIASVFEDFKVAKELEKGRDITQMDYTKNDPTQLLSEGLLTRMQKAGLRQGGLAKMAKGGAARGMKKLKGIYNEVETSMGKGKGAQFEQSASPLNIMREGIGQWTGKNLDVQLKDLEDQALSPAYQKAIEDSLRADRVKAAAGDKAAQARIPTFEKVLAQGLAQRQWVNSNLKNYVKKQMGSPNDPVRALAEKGVTHIRDNGQMWRGQVPKAETNRMRAGLPTLGLGQSAEAKAWETLSDNTLSSMLPEDVPLSLARGNDWIKDLPEDERVLFYTHGPELGFEKLVDNINERMDAGEIRPDQLNKVSVADAVKNVHDERVRKEDLAKKVMQKNAATKTHKEYPTGYKWVEISANKDSPLPEGWEQLPNGTYVDPQGQGSIHNPNYIALQEALEHEGDIMGHCVGNYCDDVYKEGTRILSLRDPKGESHATVQVIPEKLYPVEWFNKLPEAEQRAIEASGYMGYNVAHSPQFKEAQAKVSPRIKQIKGKQDEPLVKKYQSMMADIANTGDYSYIDELHNAGLKEKGKVLTEYEEQWLKSKGYQVPKYILEDDINVMRKALYDNGVPSNPPEAGMAKGGAAKGAKAVMSLADQVKAEMAAEKQYGQISGMVSKVGQEGRSPIIPVPNRWFLQPDKFPNQQKLIERVLQQTGMRREDFPSGAFIDPRTGEVLDSRIMDDLGVVINPATNRPMMSAKGQSGLEVLNPKTGAYTKSNLVRKGLFKPEGGDPLLNDLNFIATIEKGDVGHKYGLATEYASPTELYNTGTGANPTLRPRSRGDLFGVGDVVGQVRIGKSNPHDVYEKLFVAPKGSDVQGKKLSKAQGGLAHMGKGGAPKGVKKVMSLADQVRAEMAMEKAGAKAPKKLFSGEDVASDAIGKAAQSAGMKAPVTATKPLTDLQDFHTSIGDEVQRRSVEAKKQMDAFNYKYNKGQRVFTEDSAKKNKAPYEIIERYRHGNNLMWEGEPWISKKIIDPETGKAKRTPYEAGYRVRGEIGEMILPESAIKGNVDMAHGGLAHMAKGGRSARGVQKAMSLADEVRAEMAAEKAAKLANPPANVKVEPAYPYQDRLNKVKPVYGARKILPREQADANKAAFLEPSVVKDRMYHGTRRNFTRFSPSTADSVFVTPDPTFASGFAHGTMSFKDPMEDVAYGRFSNPDAKFKDPEYQVDNANILPVRVQVRNPFDYEDEWQVEALRDWLKQNTQLDKKHIDAELDIMSNPETSANWSNIEHPVVQKAIKALGHDAYYTKELDTKNLGVYNPNMVKSDIGNIGTWSTKTPEITEKKGGLV
jgi:hypothetical protein